jgi:hypothetical protein
LVLLFPKHGWSSVQTLPFLWLLWSCRLIFRIVEAARRLYRYRRPEAGNWLEAPIAEIDKSTTGKLLANRMAREPGLHVVVRGRGSAPEPVRSDALYDEELDG